MCGIAGFVGDFASGLVSRMNVVQKHRGPDGQGIFEDPEAQVALGHVRLFILDLTPAAAQPMHSPDGRFIKHSITALRKKVSKILTKGDESVLSLGLQEKAKEIVTDDDGLGKLAMALGFDVKAAPDLLMEGLKKNRLSIKDFEILVRGLVIENRLRSAAGELYVLEGRKDVKR